VLIPQLGEPTGHVLSALLLSALLAALIWFTIGWVKPSTPRVSLGIGLLWVCMTLAFEFGFGRLVAHKPWPELLADYDLVHGRIWPLVLITIGVIPYIAARARHLIR
jgi:hypothetical protein